VLVMCQESQHKIKVVIIKVLKVVIIIVLKLDSVVDHDRLRS
jgi:hypothetical protein